MRIVGDSTAIETRKLRLATRFHRLPLRKPAVVAAVVAVARSAPIVARIRFAIS
jgi:hypothetical protein